MSHETSIEMNDLNQSNQEEDIYDKIRKQTYHPFVLIFTFIFKAIPVFAYFIIFFIFSDWFIICFSITLLAIAVDFWFTKNISGRILCGLRWWNRIDNNGKSEWIFECLSDEKRVRLSKFEIYCFWILLIVNNVLWILTVLTCTLTFKPHYLVLVIIAAILATTNTIGFVRCYATQAKQMKEKLKGKANEILVKKATEALVDQITHPSKK